MQPDRDTVYLWLDSGFTDYYGNPIMISLLNSYGEYRGHYFGSFQTLSNLCSLKLSRKLITMQQLRRINSIGAVICYLENF